MAGQKQEGRTAAAAEDEVVRGEMGVAAGAGDSGQT